MSSLKHTTSIKGPLCLDESSWYNDKEADVRNNLLRVVWGFARRKQKMQIERKTATVRNVWKQIQKEKTC